MGTSLPHLYIFGGNIIFTLMALATTAWTEKRQEDTVVETRMTKSEARHLVQVALPGPAMGPKPVITASKVAEATEAATTSTKSRRIKRDYDDDDEEGSSFESTVNGDTTETTTTTTATTTTTTTSSSGETDGADGAAVAAGAVVGVVVIGVIVAVIVTLWLWKTRRNNRGKLAKRQANENSTHTNSLEAGQNGAQPETAAYLSLRPAQGAKTSDSDYQALVNNYRIEGQESLRRNAAGKPANPVSTEVQDKPTDPQRQSLSDDDDMTIEENDLYEQGPEPQDDIQAGSGDHSSTNRPEDNSRIYGPSDGQVDGDEDGDNDDDDMTLEENDLYEQGPQ